MFLVAFPLVGLLAAYGLSASHQDRYESSAKLLLHEPAAAVAPADAPDGASAAASSRETATNVDLVSSDEVALRVYTALRPLTTLDAFLDSVRIASKGDSELVTITARDADPALAARIANTWADQYRAFRREADDARAAAATRIVDQRLAALPPDRLAGAEGQGLRRQRDELAVAASLQRANVEVAQRAREATTPVSPRPLRAALIGGLAGLVIALVLALLAQRLDRRVADADAAAALHGLPLLGQIPKAAALATAAPGASGEPSLPPLAAGETDAFRVLRTSISYPDVERRIGSVLITSAVSGEGKTTVALNLARAYAESGARTLMIEGDLRRPVLSARLALAATPGLADVLRSEARLESATRRVALDAGGGSGRGARLDIVVAGAAASNPQTLLEGKRMSRLLEELEDRYDMVVVDGAPGLGVSDAAPLMREVGAVLVVSRVGRTQIHESQALRDRLELLGVRPLGVVANGVSRRAGHYSTREMAPVPG
jgi:polysaccharide biosynthesis transport protein